MVRAIVGSDSQLTNAVGARTPRVGSRMSAEMGTTAVKAVRAAMLDATVKVRDDDSDVQEATGTGPRPEYEETSRQSALDAQPWGW